MTQSAAIRSPQPQQLRQPPPAAKPAAPLTITRGKKADPPRIMLYSLEGLGKSTFAAESPAPLFLDVEKGSGHLDVARLLDDATWSWPLLLSTIQALETSPALDGFKTVVLDTVDAAEQLLWAHLVDKHHPKSKEGLTGSIEAFGYGKGYQLAFEEWRGLLAALERVRRARGVSVILLGHCVVKTFKNPAGEDFDRYQPKLHEKSAGLLKGWCDVVAFGAHETVVDAKTSKTVGTGARVIHTQWSTAYDAKARYSIPEELPLDAAEFWRALAAGQTGQPDHLRRQIEQGVALLVDAELAGVARAEVAKSGDDTERLSRILDRVHARIRTQEAPPEADAATAEEVQ